MKHQPVNRADVDTLYAHVETLNAMSWDRASRQPYFVNRRTDEYGVITHFVDR